MRFESIPCFPTLRLLIAHFGSACHSSWILFWLSFAFLLHFYRPPFLCSLFASYLVFEPSNGLGTFVDSMPASSICGWSGRTPIVTVIFREASVWSGYTSSVWQHYCLFVSPRLALHHILQSLLRQDSPQMFLPWTSGLGSWATNVFCSHDIAPLWTSSFDLSTYWIAAEGAVGKNLLHPSSRVDSKHRITERHQDDMILEEPRYTIWQSKMGKLQHQPFAQYCAPEAACFFVYQHVCTMAPSGGRYHYRRHNKLKFYFHLRLVATVEGIAWSLKGTESSACIHWQNHLEWTSARLVGYGVSVVRRGDPFALRRQNVGVVGIAVIVPAVFSSFCKPVLQLCLEIEGLSDFHRFLLIFDLIIQNQILLGLRHCAGCQNICFYRRGVPHEHFYQFDPVNIFLFTVNAAWYSRKRPV